MVGAIANPVLEGSKSKHAKTKFVIFLQNTKMIEILKC